MQIKIAYAIMLLRVYNYYNLKTRLYNVSYTHRDLQDFPL